MIPVSNVISISINFQDDKDARRSAMERRSCAPDNSRPRTPSQIAKRSATGGFSKNCILLLSGRFDAAIAVLQNAVKFTPHARPPPHTRTARLLAMPLERAGRKGELIIHTRRVRTTRAPLKC
jgi:hypothetical protein